jgi:tetratricopeptide (TPR) repeat protein
VEGSILALAALAIVTGPLVAQDTAVQRGFEHFYNLEYPEAIAEFQRAIAAEPDNPEFHNHLAQSIVFQEMYRNGALESELVSGSNSFLRRPRLNPAPETESWFLAEVAKAMNLGEERLRRNPRDTAALYALGISYGLRSNYFWVVKKSWRESLKDATAARRYHNRISEIDPNDVDARLVQGLHDYIVGSLPWTWRTLGFMVGIHGDKEKGTRTVLDVARNGRRNRADAEIFLCAIYRRDNQTRLAVPLVQDLVRRFPRNYLLRMELSQMYSMAGDGKAAIAAIEEVARLKRDRAAGYERVPWEKIWFHEGTIQFWYRDLDGGLENLKKVVTSGAELDLNTGAAAWLRIGQIYDMTARRSQALEAYRKSIAFAPQADAAQEARRYLATPYRR